MSGLKQSGPLGSKSNQPVIDAGTNARTQATPSTTVGPELRANPISPVEAKWTAFKDWISELGESGEMLTWWLIGSPALGFPNGDLEYGTGDPETEHIKNTAAYQEAVVIYQDWLNHGSPSGKYNINGTDCQWVPEKGYFFVTGRTGGFGPDRGHWSEPLEHPLWGFTGNFGIRFTETGYPKEGYVSVEIENYTSLASYMHGLAGHSFTDSWYTKTSGVPILSRSRQVYRFISYIARNAAAGQGLADGSDAAYEVIPGDSLSALAKTYYGDMELWPILYNRNRDTIGANPDKIKAGLCLFIPSKQKLTPDQIMKAKQKARSSRAGSVPASPPR